MAALSLKFVEKPWGVERLPPPFAGRGEGRKIGEIWFEPPAQLPELLIKYIFTSENLSVQVHPTDRQTLLKGLGRQGKEECWLVVAAEPGAKLGMGFDAPLAPGALRAAAQDGSIEHRLTWHSVSPGDFFYIPANTVHAIGAGVTVVEIQQNSDITYRLYDYGRPRSLHLEDGVAVARAEPYDADRWHKHIAFGEQQPAGNMSLVEKPYFRLDFVEDSVPASLSARYAEAPLLIVPLAGEATVGGVRGLPGECLVAPDLATLSLAEGARALLAQPLNRA